MLTELFRFKLDPTSPDFVDDDEENSNEVDYQILSKPVSEDLIDT